MLETKFTIEGIDQIEKALGMMPDRIAKKVAQRSLKKGAKVIQNAMLQRAPHRSGKLFSSIAVGIAKLANFTVAVRVGLKPVDGIVTGKGRKRAVGKHRPFYASMLEFGWTDRAGVKHKLPWARPAFDESKEAALGAVLNDLAVGVEEQAQKIAGELGSSGLVKKVRF